MLILGVTGSFGTGKSTVAGIFKKLGAKVIDADKIAHGLLRPGSSVYKETVLKFGKSALGTGGVINRKALAEIVFNDARKLSLYLKIIHPAIIRIFKREIKQARQANRKRIIVLDAPLLIEAGLEKEAGKLIVVKTNRVIQISRLKNKFGLARCDILKRIKFQLPLSAKLGLADYIVDNNRSIKQTEEQVRKIWVAVKRESQNG